MKHHKKSFTLIELLMVIAIIAILASMLLPTLNSSRAMGRRITCAGNLKQIGGGFMMYGNDYDGYIGWQTPDGESNYQNPNFWSSIVGHLYLGGQTSSETLYWAEQPGSWRIFACPEDKVERTDPNYYPYKRSYAVPMALMGTDYTYNKAANAKYTNITQPSSTYNCLEVDATGQYTKFYNATVCRSGTNGEPVISFANWIGIPHLNTSNILFVDGHVASRKEPKGRSSALSYAIYRNYMNFTE